MTGERAPFHLHVQVNPNSMLAGAFGRDRVLAAFAAAPMLLEDVSVTFGETPAELEAALPTTEVLLLTGSAPLHELARRAPRLRWLHYTSAGVEWLLLAGLPPDVILTNASGTHQPKVAEFALLAALMLHNHVPALVGAQQRQQWRPLPAPTLAGRTALILGMGALGSAAAGALSRAGLRVIGVSRSAQPHPSAEAVHSTPALPNLLPLADLLLIALPLTAETRGLVDRTALDRLPCHAGIINIGRGPVLDTEALADKLRDGSLAGAVLDALPQEPLPPDAPLWSVPNLMIMPHCGLYDPDAYGPRCLSAFLDNLDRFRTGAPLRHRVDPVRGY